MRTYLTALLLCLTVGCATAQSLAAPRTLSGPGAKEVALFRQDILLSGENVLNVRTGPLATSSQGFGISTAGVILPVAPIQGARRIPVEEAIREPVTSQVRRWRRLFFARWFPQLAQEQYITRKDALEQARRWVQSEFPAVKDRIAQYIAAEGISMAIYNFQQEYEGESAGGSKKLAIAFNASIDSKGRATYGNPKIVDPDPTVVEVQYSVKTSIQGIPGNWAYPDAGAVKWRILNKQYAPLSGWYTADVNGLFDPKGSEDPDDGLRCLMDSQNTGCTPHPSDVAGILDISGASHAIVTYVRGVEPDTVTVGDEEVAKLAMSVDSRIYTCTSYINRGHFGFVLGLISDQYLAEPTEPLVTYRQINQFAAQGTSPTNSYEKIVPLSALQGRNPDQFIISPLEGDNTLIDRNDRDLMAGVTYVAPIIRDPRGEMTNFNFAGDMAVSVISETTAGKDLYIGTVGDNYWRTGLYDRTVHFNLEDPSLLEDMRILQAGFDDYLQVAINGTIVYLGPYGGNMLDYNYNNWGESESNCAYDWESGAWQCTRPAPNPSVSYRNCTAQSGGGYLCNQSGCPTGFVRLTERPAQIGAGCHPPELATNWNVGLNINLMPYLRQGMNTLNFRVIVAGAGEGWIRLRYRTCGMAQGYSAQAEPLPAYSGEAGVNMQMNNMLTGIPSPQ